MVRIQGCRFVANRAPVNLIATTVLAVAENQAVGTFVGAFSATDTDGDPLSYHLSGGVLDNTYFSLDENGSLRTAVEFDFESNVILRY